MADGSESALGAGTSTPAETVARLLLVTAVFVQQVVSGFYIGLERELPDAFPILSSLFFWLSVVTWFALYSQRHHVPWVLDMGWFLFGAGIVLIPYYLFKREGRVGLARVGLFCLTWFAAWAMGWAVLLWMRVLHGGE